jgi:hypothetical protein
MAARRRVDQGFGASELGTAVRQRRGLDGTPLRRALGRILNARASAKAIGALWGARTRREHYDCDREEEERVALHGGGRPKHNARHVPFAAEDGDLRKPQPPTETTIDNAVDGDDAEARLFRICRLNQRFRRQ